MTVAQAHDPYHQDPGEIVTPEPPKASPDDVFRRLSIACAQIAVAGDEVRFDHWAKADEAYQAIRFDGQEDLDLYLSQRFLMDAFRMVRRLGWHHKESRELLWAAIRFFGLAQSSHHDKGLPEAEPRWWWREQ